MEDFFTNKLFGTKIRDAFQTYLDPIQSFAAQNKAKLNSIYFAPLVTKGLTHCGRDEGIG